MRELAGWYREDGRLLAQLAAWRRIMVVAARAGDVALGREARTMIRALQILVEPADPVAFPVDPDAVRRALAAIARRGA
jgi:hypothetical protein